MLSLLEIDFHFKAMSKIRRHIYEDWALFAVYEIESKFSVYFPSEQFYEYLREAVVAIARACRSKPEFEKNRAYLKKVGKNEIFKAISSRSCSSIKSEVFKLEKRHSSNWFERNQSRIYEILFNSRKRKGGKRAIEAASRDYQIIYFAALGWNTSEIAKELGISYDSCKKYRQKICLLLQSILNGIESQTIESKGQVNEN